jgi:ATP-dependent DNA helicase RecQ
LLNHHNGKSGIIYCLSRKKVEEVAQALALNGVNAMPYHAGLDAKVRADTQDKFLMEDIDVIVATIAFGMGIDKPDVRYVIHHDMPKSMEGYYQETGRSGRDGGEGICVAFYSEKDIDKLQKFMKDKPVSEREIGTQILKRLLIMPNRRFAAVSRYCITLARTLTKPAVIACAITAAPTNNSLTAKSICTAH